MLYTEFLKQGVEGAALIDEYAKYHLATGRPIKEYKDQKWISSQQILNEYFMDKTSFNPLICDSCIWLGKVYCDLNGWEIEEDYKAALYAQQYDVTIYVPLQHTTGEVSEFRVHDGMAAAKIAYLIEQELLTKSNVVYAPVDYRERDDWVKQFVQQWKEKNSESRQLLAANA
jgi:hypothetical protein